MPCGEVGDHEPEDFETIARRYVAERLEAVQTVGNKLRALRFFAKMFLTPAPDMEEYENGQNHPFIREPVYSPDSEEWLASHGEKGSAFPVPLPPVRTHAG